VALPENRRQRKASADTAWRTEDAIKTTRHVCSLLNQHGSR